MATRKTIKYSKRDKWLDGDMQNQVIEFTVIGRNRIELLKRTSNSLLICDYYHQYESINPVLHAELQWLAINQRGIFRLLAMYLNPRTSAYRDMADLAAKHGIPL